MKEIILLLSLFIVTGLSAQDEMLLSNCPEDFVVEGEREVFRLAELMPSWVGCETIDFPAKRDDCTAEYVGAFIDENLVYPEEAKEKKPKTPLGNWQRQVTRRRNK